MATELLKLFGQDETKWKDSGGGKPTQTAQALARIRDDILSGRMAPGERLIVANLAERLAASQTPIREALMRLASEGLVLLEEQRGFTVAPVTRDDLLQLTMARIEIEALVLRVSIEQGDDEWEGQIVAALHRLKKATKLAIQAGRSSSEWESLHENFHRVLVSACDNRVLLEFREQLFRRGTRYRRLSARVMNTLRENMEFHEMLAEAVLERDVATAEALMKEHVRKAAYTLLDETAPI